MGVKVYLRKKPISKGRYSLYLDFWPPITIQETGKKTRREVLRMYILKNPKTEDERNHNKEQLWIAEQIRKKRENASNKPEIYTEQELEQLRLKKIRQQSFIEYFEKLTNKRSGGNYTLSRSCLKYLKLFNENLTFGDLNKSTCEDFREYLLNVKSLRSEERKLSRNTAAGYFNKFKAALRQAHEDDLIQNDLHNKVKPIQEEETYREFLTVQELNKLIEMPCKEPVLKRAALFSALTGLRFSDIQRLTWDQLESLEDGYYIRFRQQKTGGIQHHPIPNDALMFMGNSGKPEEKIFRGLRYSAYGNKNLAQWIGSAGITKNVTFHSFRHTFAVIQLANGTDIYTVSKLMGHRDLKTTEIYAKIVNNTKREAMDKMKLNI